jgi:hypothetical protein
MDVGSCATHAPLVLMGWWRAEHSRLLNADVQHPAEA